MNGRFNKFLWKIKIDISEFTEDENHFITLREPTIQEFKIVSKLQELFSKAKEEDIESLFDGVSEFCKVCNTLIIDHDFYTEGENSQKLSSKDVAEFLESKFPLCQEIIAEYMKNLPLAKASGKK